MTTTQSFKEPEQLLMSPISILSLPIVFSSAAIVLPHYSPAEEGIQRGSGRRK